VFGLSSPFVHLVADIGYPVLCRAVGSLMHRHAVDHSTYPRGPRSGSGYVVPIHHHLIGPYPLLDMTTASTGLLLWGVFCQGPPHGAYRLTPCSVSLFDLSARFLAPTHTD
jgi:hypothetical protein